MTRPVFERRGRSASCPTGAADVAVAVRAIADVAVADADQNERDYAAFTAAIRDGRIPAHE